MSTKRTVWTWGLISGGISSGLMLAVVPFADRIGFDRGAIFGYTGLVLSALMIFFGVRSYKHNVAGGRLTFGKGFKVGLLIALISSLLYVATWQIVYFQCMPDFLEKYRAHVVEKARSDGKSASEIEKMNADMAKFQELYRNPLFNAAITLIEPLPFGLAAAAISAGILRTRRTAGPA
jgi:hypothetical protein